MISYGQNIADDFWRSATYVDKILKGAKPEDLPVEQPVTFELVANVKTAKALGLTILQTKLVRADPGDRVGTAEVCSGLTGTGWWWVG